MMDCNWLVKVALNDRAALVTTGMPKPEVDALDHKEVVAELKNRGYKWSRAVHKYVKE